MTPQDILRIRDSDESLSTLAERYGVSRSTIANIKNGRTHKDPTLCPTCRRPYEDKQIGGIFDCEDTPEH